MASDRRDPRICQCAATGDIERHFDRVAEERRATGGGALHPVSQRLLAALRGVGPAGSSVLELGCGGGFLLTELLRDGAARVTGVDLSGVSIDEARERLRVAGYEDRAELIVGDGSMAPLEVHDWVILDRAICCYPDVEALLGNAIPAAGRVVGFTIPASRGWRGAVARTMIALENLIDFARRNTCRGYVHDVNGINRRLADAGFRLREEQFRRLWHISVFERPA